MGTLKGIVQFTGHFDGLSFYKPRGQHIRVRKTGGFDGEKIKTLSTYERTRENAEEFRHVATVGKAFRWALRGYLHPMRIPYGHNRVVQLFHQIKNCDLVHARGQRQVVEGLATAEGLALLGGFDFDPRHPMAVLFPLPYTASLTTGALFIPGFDSSRVLFPEGATMAEVRFILLRMDFGLLQTSPLEQSSYVFSKGASVPDTTLTTAMPAGDGRLVGLLWLGFRQKVNGVVYPLQEQGLRVVF